MRARVYSYTGRPIGFWDGAADWRQRRGQNPRRLPGYGRGDEFTEMVRVTLREHPGMVNDQVTGANALYKWLKQKGRLAD